MIVLFALQIMLYGIQFNNNHTLLKKTCVVFLSSYTETQVEVWENEKYCQWEHKPQASASTAFRVLPNSHECFYNLIETWSTCFLFLLENTTC